MGYIPQLDSLRAMAAIAVVLFHSKVSLFPGGYLGVDVFFVLSGYLITTILVSESRSGQIDLLRFYLRRIKRLYPALIFFLVCYVAAASYFHSGFEHWKGALAAGLYTLDYMPAYAPARYVHHTWSLAAEVHFYLIWPLIIMFVLRRNDEATLHKVVLWIAIAGTAWTTVNQFCGFNAYNRMDVRIGQMAWGGWIGLYMMRSSVQLPPSARRAIATTGLIAIAYLIWLGVPNPWKMSLAAPVASAATIAFIYGAQSLRLDNAVITWLGKMSYGIYLWHFPLVLYLLRSEYRPMTALIALGASVFMAAVSYYTIESYFRRNRSDVRGSALVGMSNGQ